MKTLLPFVHIRPRSSGLLVVLLASVLAQAGAVAWAAPASLIPTNAPWKYLDTGVDPGTAWRAAAFDDSVWPTGLGPLGYGEPFLHTTLNLGSGTNRLLTAYFRRMFVVTNAAAITNLITRLLRDDGAVAYLNNVEVFRHNLPAGAVNYWTLATTVVGGSDETTYFTNTIPSNLLLNGTNILAVEVHQNSATSADLTFDLELIAQTSAPTSNAPPTVQIVQPADHSVFFALADMLLIARGGDPERDLRQVEFFAGTNSLGLATRLVEDTTQIWPPELAEAFGLRWTNVPVGRYELTARATDGFGNSTTSAPVHVAVVPDTVTVVNLTVTDPEAREFPPLLPGIDPATFTIHRTGNTNVELVVRYLISGTASNGVDYAELSGWVRMAAGVTNAEVMIFPLNDTLTEGTETVILTAISPLCGPFWPPPPECYLTGPNATATAYIYDYVPLTNQPPTVAMVTPTNGATFPGGTNILLGANASDPDGPVMWVEFFAGTNRLGTAHGPLHTPAGDYQLTWSNVPPGAHVLTARATDSAGLTATSAPVVITVRESPSADRELHVVGIHEAATVSVVVDRPGKGVTLFLSAYNPVTWQVSTMAGSVIEQVILGGYHTQTVVGLPPGVPVVPAFYEGGVSAYLWIGYQIDSARFQRTVPKLHNLTGLEIASFQGQYGNPYPTYLINRVVDDPRLRSDYPQPVPSSEWPINPTFPLSFFSGSGAGIGNVFHRTYTLAGPPGGSALLPGMRVVADAGQRFYYAANSSQGPLKIDSQTGTATLMQLGSGVPELSWPMGMAFDSQRGRVLLASLGGEGFLYAYAPQPDQWSLVASMDNRDLDSLVYNAAEDRLYGFEVYRGDSRRPRLFRLSAAGVYQGEIQLPVLPYDIGVAGYQSELVSVGDYLALLIGPEPNFHPADQTDDARLYLIEPRSGQSWLTYRQVGPTPVPPVITAQPASQTITAGLSVTFSVTATGPPPLSYQWQKDGANLSGQTRTDLTLVNVQLTDAGRYRVIVSNSAGSVTSAVATLTVLPAAANLVTTTADSGPGSLRAVLAAAPVGSTITFAVTGAVTLTSGELRLGGSVHLAGPGADRLAIQRSSAPSTPAFRLFHVEGSARLSGLTLRGGRISATDTYVDGASILNQGSLVIEDCVVSDHEALGEYSRGGAICNRGTLIANRSTFARNAASGYYGEGGAIYNYGTLAVTNCTFSGNSVGMWGGAIHNDMMSGGTALESCTFTANSAAFGGGIFNRGHPPYNVSPVYLRNTILVGNTGYDIGHCSLIESGGYNLIGTIGDPYGSMALPLAPGPGDRTNVNPAAVRLRPLQLNNGATLTHALGRHSLAREAGPPSGFPATDQRGVARPFGSRCDIGAFEADSLPPNTAPIAACPPSAEWQAGPSGTATGTLNVTVRDDDGDSLAVVWSVDGAAQFTNNVPGAATQTVATVSQSFTLAVGAHAVRVAVSDGEAGAECAAAVQVLPRPAPAAYGKMYWADNQAGCIQRADLDGTRIETVVANAGRPWGLAIDDWSGHLYWAEDNPYLLPVIERCNLDGSDPEVLISEPWNSGAQFPQFMALDVAGGKMYYTSGNTRSIERADLDGSNPQRILTADLNGPVGIALDLRHNHIYWTHIRSTHSRICRSNLDGSGTVELLYQQGFFYAIQLDLDGGYMYWADQHSNYRAIRRANLDGSNPVSIVTGIEPSGLALDLINEKVYWSTRGTPSIQRANLDGTGVETLISRTNVPGLDYTMDVAIVHLPEPPVITRQPASRTIYAGQSATFSVTASGAPPLAFQWQKNGTDLLGQTQVSLTLANAQVGDAAGYRVRVSNVSGSVTSAVAILTVLPIPTSFPPSVNHPTNCGPGGDGSSNYQLSSPPDQPADLHVVGVYEGSVNANRTVTVRVNATNKPVVLALSAHSPATWNVAPAPAAQILAVFVSGYHTQTVTGLPVGVPIHQVNFGAYAYGWETNRNTGGGNYRLMIQNVRQITGMVESSYQGCYAGNVFEIPFAPPPNSPPIIACPAPASFSVSAPTSVVATLNAWVQDTDGDALTVVWAVDGLVRQSNVVTILNPSEFAFVSASLALGVGHHDISVSVSDGGALPVTCSTFVEVLPPPAPPIITQQPVSQTNFVGSTVTLSVAATGTPPPRYQWQKNGTNLIGQTSTSLTLANAQLTDAGRYRVIVSNAAGSVTSTEANLTVLPHRTGPGSLDPTFSVNLDGPPNVDVLALAKQPDRRILIGGEFASVNGVARTSVARLFPNGAVDTSFNAVLNDLYTPTVRALAVQADGKIVIGGYFTNVNGVARCNVARLNPDGSLDAGVNAPTNTFDYVYAISLQSDGKILVAGHNYDAGRSIGVLIRFNADGSLDPSYSLIARGGYGIVAMTVPPDDKALIAGEFGSVNGVGPASVSRINPDGTVDLSFASGEGGGTELYGLALQRDGKILISGYVPNALVRLNPNGSVDASFTSAAGVPPDEAFPVVQADGRILVGGRFCGAAFPDVPFPGIRRLDPNGSVDASFDPGTGTEGGTVKAILLQDDGQILVGGYFDRFDGVPCRGLVRLNNHVEPAVVITWPTPVNIVYGTPLGGDQLNATANVPGSLEYDPPAGILLDAGTHTLSVIFTPENPFLYTPVTAIVQITVERAPLAIVANNQVRLYGQPNPEFTATYWGLVAGDAPADLDTPVTLTTAATHASPPGTYAITASGARDANYNVSFGDGTLTVLPVPPQPGAVDLSFDPTASGQRPGITEEGASVHAIVRQPDGKILIGGGFNAVNGAARNEIARLNPDGTTDLSFNPGRGPDQSVFAVALQPDGKILLGGYFVNVDGRLRQSLARLHADGSLDTSFDARVKVEHWASVFAIQLQPDGKILIAGEFVSVAGVPRFNLARLHADGTLDTSFAPPDFEEQHGQIRAIQLLPDGKLLVGHFNTPNLYRLNSDGRVDESFQATLATSSGWGGPTALALQADGRIVVAGWFDSAGGLPRNHMARLNADGSVDPDFDPPLPSAAIYALAVQPDQKILLAGDIDNSTSNNRRGVDRLNPDGSYDLTFQGGGQDWVRNGYAVLVEPDGHILAGGIKNEHFNTPSALLRLTPDGRLAPGFAPALERSDMMQLRHLLLQPDGRMLISGFFDMVNGVRRPGFARLLADGTLDASFVPDTNLHASLPDFVLQTDGKIVVAGSVYWQTRSGANNVWHDGVARLHPDGSLDYSFNPVASTPGGFGVVEAVAIQPDGRILLGGVVSGLVRLNPDGSEDATFHPPRIIRGAGSMEGVNCLAVQPDGKILVGGGFHGTDGGGPALLVRLNTDGTIDTSFHTPGNLGWTVLVLALQPDGKILVGSGGDGSGPLVRLHPDGSGDGSFSSPFDGHDYIHTIAVQPNGKILAGAWVDNRLLRLNPDGSLDPVFQVVLAVGWGTAYATQVQPDGRVLCAGSFTSVNGVTMHGIVRLFGDPPEPASFVNRHIADQQVQLVATPLASVSVYAVEDQPPAGWPVTNISRGGVFDAATGKVKFGPFYDAEPRMLSYEVLSPVWGIHCALGVFCFRGQASADGVNSPIGGDQCRVLAGYFPADVTPANRHISIEEVTAYGAAWRRGSNWLCHAQGIPIDYVTRAAFLWRAGECYAVDFLITNEPLWWVPCRTGVSPVPGIALPSSAQQGQAGSLSYGERRAPAFFIPGEPLTVTVAVSPAVGAGTFAVEDQLPSGWVAAGISHGGEFDAAAGKVKWGPFLDATARDLSYQAVPPASANGAVAFAGAASFDGASMTVTGTRQIRAGSRLRVAPEPGTGRLVLSLAGPMGSRYRIETSTDLAQWLPLVEVTASPGGTALPLGSGPGERQRFYRATLIE